MRLQSLFFMLVFLSLLLLLSCQPLVVQPEIAKPVGVVTVSKIEPVIEVAPFLRYDLSFRRWGEFYFPFEDWKWFKSQSIAESNLNPDAISWCGAGGLMQLMPATAQGLGIKNRFDPEENIQGGIKYDKQVEGYFKIVDQPERRKLMFAGYNAGPGHIIKARNLTQSDSWDIVSKSLYLFTGKHSTETIGYVKRIHDTKKRL